MLDVRDEAIRLAIQDNLTLAARRTRESGKMKTTDDAQKLAGIWEDDRNQPAARSVLETGEYDYGAPGGPGHQDCRRQVLP